MELSCGKVSARLQPATARHARVVLSKTVTSLSQPVNPWTLQAVGSVLLDQLNSSAFDNPTGVRFIK